MANFTYTVLYMGAEIAACDGETFEYARETALEDVPDYYPREDLEFVATCDSGPLRHVEGPCYL